MSNITGKLFVDVEGNTDGLRRSLKRSEKDVSNFGRAVNSTLAESWIRRPPQSGWSCCIDWTWKRWEAFIWVWSKSSLEAGIAVPTGATEEGCSPPELPTESRNGHLWGWRKVCRTESSHQEPSKGLGGG